MEFKGQGHWQIWEYTGILHLLGNIFSSSDCQVGVALYLIWWLTAKTVI